MRDFGGHDYSVRDVEEIIRTNERVEAERERLCAQRDSLTTALREALDALAMYVAGIEGNRHQQGAGTMANFHASSSAGGHKALESGRAALSSLEDT